MGETCKKYSHPSFRICEFREETRCRGRTSVVGVNKITFKGVPEHPCCVLKVKNVLAKSARCAKAYRILQSCTGVLSDPRVLSLIRDWSDMTDRLYWWCQENYVRSRPLILYESFSNFRSSELQGWNVPVGMTYSSVVYKTILTTCYVLSLGKRYSWAHSTACFWKLHVACFFACCMCILVLMCLTHVPACWDASVFFTVADAWILHPTKTPILCPHQGRVLKSCDGELGYLLISVTCWYYKSICLSCKIVILRYPLSTAARTIIQ